MEQDEREIPGLLKGKEKEHDLGGGAPVPGGVAGAEGGLARGASSSSEQEGVSEAGNGGCHAAAGSESESDDEEDVESVFASEASTEDLERDAPAVGNAARGDAPGNGRNEDPAMFYFELRGFRRTRRAVAHAMPPSSYRRLPLRRRKQYIPTRFIFAGDAASGIGIANAHDPGTSEAAAASVPLPTGSPSATTAGVSAMANVDHGAKNEATVSTAARSEIDVAVDTSCSDDHNTESKDAEAATARASSSCRHPSRGRKQRRPDRCISDAEGDAGDAGRAKARRGNVVLDRFLAYLVCTSPEQRPEWVRHVTAECRRPGAARQQCLEDGVTGRSRRST